MHCLPPPDSFILDVMMMTTSPASFIGARTTMLLCVALLLLVLHHDDAAVLAINLPYDLSLIPKECPDVSNVGWYCGVFPALPALGITCAWVCYVSKPQFLKPGIAFQPTPLKPSLGFIYCFLPGGCENAGIQSQCGGQIDWYFEGGNGPFQSGFPTPGGYYVCGNTAPAGGIDLSLIHTNCQGGVFYCEKPQCDPEAWFCNDGCDPLNNPNCPVIDNSAIARGCGTSQLYFNGLWLCPTCPACTNDPKCVHFCPAPMLALLGGFGSSEPPSPPEGLLRGKKGLPSPLSSCTSKNCRRASRKNCGSTLKKLRAAYVTNDCNPKESSSKACIREARKVFPKSFVCSESKKQLAASKKAQPSFLDFPNPCFPLADDGRCESLDTSADG